MNLYCVLGIVLSEVDMMTPHLINREMEAQRYRGI